MTTDPIEAALVVLERAAAQFRFYRDQHRAKRPPDDEKAMTNQAWASECEQVIAAARAVPDENALRDWEGEYKALAKALVGETGASAIITATVRCDWTLPREELPDCWEFDFLEDEGDCYACKLSSVNARHSIRGIGPTPRAAFLVACAEAAKG